MHEVLNRMNLHGRVVVCGLISAYNSEDVRLVSANMSLAIIKRLRIQGFLVFDYASRFTDAAMELGKWKMMGKLKDRQTLVEGLEKVPEAINMLFNGENIGKLIVKI